MNEEDFHDFMVATLAAGGIPVLFRMRRVNRETFEYEFLWKPYHNSTFPLIRSAYNLSNYERTACIDTYKKACASLGVTAAFKHE